MIVNPSPGQNFHSSRFRLLGLGMKCAIGWLILSLTLQSGLRADEFTFARPQPFHSIQVDAGSAVRWRDGKYEVLHLRQGIRIQQAEYEYSADEAIVWVELPEAEPPPDEGATEPPTFKVVLYLEGSAKVQIPGSNQARPNSIVDDSWLGRLFTSGTVNLNVRSTMLKGDPPSIFERAKRQREQGWRSSSRVASFQQAATEDRFAPGNRPVRRSQVVNPLTGELQLVQPVQEERPRSSPELDGRFWPSSTGNTGKAPLSGFRTPSFQESSDEWEQPVPASGESATRATANGASPSVFAQPGIQFGRRSAAVDLDLKRRVNPNNPNEEYLIATGGVRVSINSPEISEQEFFRNDVDPQVTILSDNVVAWITRTYDGTRNYEVYLEGNVVFTKGRRVIYADQMYYNVTRRSGTILSAEILTPAEKYEGLVRLKADVIEQVDENNMQAYGAAFTSSRMGVPRYWLQSENMLLSRQSTPAVDPVTGYPLVDPQTGMPQAERNVLCGIQWESNLCQRGPGLFLAPVPS